jgi:predicted transposase YdaD
MTVLLESPWYQEILQKGENRGRREGALREAQSLILRQLTRRIGNVAPEIRSQVEASSITQLEALGDSLLDFSSSDDLANWLRRTEQTGESQENNL